MLLKAGTYRFNDVLDLSTEFEQSINFYYVEDVDGLEMQSNYTSLKVIGNNLQGYQTSISAGGETYNTNFEKVLYSVDKGYEGRPQEHTLPTDQEVDGTFGNWYIANTNYNEVNPTEDKEYIEKASWYTSVANAIRSKKGTSEPINRDDFASEISSISVGETLPEYDGTVIIEKAESLPYENGVLKAGTYRFNDVINGYPPIIEGESPYTHSIDLPFIFTFDGNDETYSYGFVTQDIGGAYMLMYLVASIGRPSLTPVYAYSDVEGYTEQGWLGSLYAEQGIIVTNDELQTITIEEDFETNEEAGTWFNANVKAVSV